MPENIRGQEADREERVTMDLSNECIYEIYVPSFCDANHDHIGDLEGILSKLDYLKETGATILWLTPFYLSPGIDQGYDISDYCAIDPLYGTMEQMMELVKQAHARGMKIIIDMVLNHTSTEHRWFRESVRNPKGTYGDYYNWYPEIPNNWESFMSGSAWEYQTERGAYYYHAFSTGQACLNWRNPRVQEEMLQIMYFWLDRGMDGFRFDVINFLKTDLLFDHDNPNAAKDETEIIAENSKTKDRNGFEQIHQYDKNQPGCPGIVAEICRKLREKKSTIFLLGEVGEKDVKLYQQYVGEGLLDTCFHFNLGSIKQIDAAQMAEAILASESVYGMTTLFFSSHDMKRFYHRLCNYNREQALLIAILMFTGRGIPVIYQGDEQQIRDKEVKCLQDIKDIQGIRCYRKQISDGKSEEQAFEKAKEETRDYSRELMTWTAVLLPEWKQLAQLRKQYKTLQKGQYGIVKTHNNMLFYTREDNGERIHIYLNFGSKDQWIEIPEKIQLLYGTSNSRQMLEAYKGIVWMEVVHEKSHNAKYCE